MRILFSLLMILTACAAHGVTPEEFDLRVTGIRAAESKDKPESAYGQYRELLRAEGLSDAQRATLYERLAMLAIGANDGGVLEEGLRGLQGLPPDSPERTRRLYSLMRHYMQNFPVQMHAALSTDRGAFTGGDKCDLYESLGSAAVRAGKMDLFDQALAWALAEPLEERVAMVGRLSGQRSGKEYYESNVKLVRDTLKAGEIAADQKAVLFNQLALLALAAEDGAVLDEALRGLQGLPDSASKTSTLFGLMRHRMEKYPTRVRDVLSVTRELFTVEQRLELCQALAGGAVRAGDMATFDQALAWLVAEPLDKRVGATAQLAAMRSGQEFYAGNLKLVRDTLNAGALTDDDRAVLFNQLAALAIAAEDGAVLDEALRGLQGLPDSASKTSTLFGLMRHRMEKYPTRVRDMLSATRELFTIEQRLELYVALASGAMRAGDMATFDQALAWVVAEPLDKRVGATAQVVAMRSGQGYYAGNVQILHDTLKAGVIDPEAQFVVFDLLAGLAIGVGDDKLLDEALQSLQSLPVSPQNTTRLYTMLRTLCGGEKPAFYMKPAHFKSLYTANEKLFTDGQKRELLGAFANAAWSANHQDAFDLGRNWLYKLPIDESLVATVSALSRTVAGSDFLQARQVLVDYLKTPGLTAEQKYQLLLLELELTATIRRTPPFDFGEVKAVMGRIEDLLRGNPKIAADAAAKAYVMLGNAALYEFDFQTARTAYEKAVALDPKNLNNVAKAAEIALIFKDRASAARHWDAFIAGNAGDPAKEATDAANVNAARERYMASIIKALDAGQDLAGVDREFAAYGFAPNIRADERRRASTVFLRALRYDEVRLLHAAVQQMMEPLEQEGFTVRYVARAPRSADAWARSELRRNPAYKESRFKLGMGISIDRDAGTDNERLKQDKPKGIDPSAPAGYETEAWIVYDEDGLHVYLEARNPEARKIGLGLLPGGFIEMFLEPGMGQPHHWTWYDLPGTAESYYIKTASPGHHYRLTDDFLVKDTCVNEDSIGVYAHFPWAFFHDSLPTDGRYWKLGVLRGTPAGAAGYVLTSLMGAHPHELSRGLTLNFEFSPEQLGLVKRDLAQRLFAAYRTERNKGGGFIATMNDPLLGDPAFYEAELKPLLADLDQAGEKLLASADAKEIDSLFNQYAPLWAELQYVVADKRVAYLRKALLTDHR